MRRKKKMKTKEAEDEDDENDWIDTSVAPSKAAAPQEVPVLKSATCGPPHSQSEAKGTSPEAENEEGVEVQERSSASNPGPQDSAEEEGDDDDEEGDDDDEDDSDASQKPVEAAKTFQVVNLDLEEKADDGITVVATVLPPPITIGIGDLDNEDKAEGAQPEVLNDAQVAHFFNWVASLTEGQRTAFAPVLARKVAGHPQIEDDGPWNLIQAHTGIFIGWPWTDGQKEEFLKLVKELDPIFFLEYEMCLHAPPPPDQANFFGDLL